MIFTLKSFPTCVDEILNSYSPIGHINPSYVTLVDFFKSQRLIGSSGEPMTTVLGIPWSLIGQEEKCNPRGLNETF